MDNLQIETRIAQQMYQDWLQAEAKWRKLDPRQLQQHVDELLEAQIDRMMDPTP